MFPGMMGGGMGGMGGLMGMMMGGRGDGISVSSKIVPETLVTSAKSLFEESVTGADVGQLFTFKDNLRPREYKSDIPLIAALISIPKRPKKKKMRDLDAWKVRMLIASDDDQSAFYDAPVFRLRRITVEEATQMIEKWRKDKVDAHKLGIPALFKTDITMPSVYSVHSPEYNPAGWRRGELMIRPLGEEAHEFEIATFVGIAQDRDPLINLLINKTKNTAYKNPNWSGWRRLTADELAMFGGTQEMADAYIARQNLIGKDAAAALTHVKEVDADDAVVVTVETPVAGNDGAGAAAA